MPKIAPPHCVLSLAAVLVAVPAIAVEPVPVAASAYRLSGEQSAFRLAGREPHAPGPDLREEPAIPAQLADKPFAAMIHRAARNAALDPALVHAVIFVESGYNPAARSPKGAVGLMQVLPETALRYGVPHPGSSPEANLRAGTRYLSDLMSLFDHRLDLALAAYNAGEQAVLRHGQRIPPYRETQLYVPAVLAKYHEWRQEPPTPVPPPARIEYLPGTRLDLTASQTARDAAAH